MNYNDLTDEQKAKVRECTTPEEILALAREAGTDLTDEELESVAGGGWGCSSKDHSLDPL